MPKKKKKPVQTKSTSGKQSKSKKKKAPPGYHYMPNGRLMKDADMKKDKNKKKGRY
tara:strand:- start:303 stop:470 length:168 start_codon:yes stop_codon:yes gene_type:complete